MPRLRSRATGVVVDVSDATAESLQGVWEPVTDTSPPEPTSKRAAKSEPTK